MSLFWEKSGLINWNCYGKLIRIAMQAILSFNSFGFRQRGMRRHTNLPNLAHHLLSAGFGEYQTRFLFGRNHKYHIG